MKFSTASLVLAAIAMDAALAGPVRHAHSHFHEKKDTELSTEAPVSKRGSALVDFGTMLEEDISKLMSLGFKAVGVNALYNNGGVWIGSDGAYTSEFTNNAKEPLVLTVWGPQGSWVNAVQPLVTHSLAPGAQVTVSFAAGQSGAWSAVYSDTELCMGQVCNTWAEYTMGPEGVVDISKEVNMNGHGMEVVGPVCTTNMDTCVFQCTGGATSCWLEYELLNCSGPGAQSGTYYGAPSGGCGGLGNGAALKTSLF